MNEYNINSSLSGVKLQFWGNEAKMIIWKSAEPPQEKQDKRVSHHQTQKERKVFEQGRFCVRCNKELSIYNDHKKCWVCLRKD